MLRFENYNCPSSEEEENLTNLLNGRRTVHAEYNDHKSISKKSFPLEKININVKLICLMYVKVSFQNLKFQNLIAYTN